MELQAEDKPERAMVRPSFILLMPSLDDGTLERGAK